MKLHELLAQMKPGDRARCGALTRQIVVMTDANGLRWLDSDSFLKVNGANQSEEWQLIQEPLPIGKWIELPTIEQLRTIQEDAAVVVVWVARAYEVWEARKLAKGCEAEPRTSLSSVPRPKRIYILPNPPEGS